MIKYTYNDKYDGQELHNTDEYLVVRAANTKSRFRRDALSERGQQVLARLRPVWSFPDTGVEILRRDKIGAEEARAELRNEKDGLLFAGRGLAHHPTHGMPLVYTENIFLKLEAGCSTSIGEIIGRVGLEAKRGSRQLGDNAYFIKAPPLTGQRVFEVADRLLRLPEVRCCYPEVLRPANTKSADSNQWHLQATGVGGVAPNAHVFADAAWGDGIRGEGVTIAVIDDGVDIKHPQFKTKEIIAPRDVFQSGDGSAAYDPHPKMPEDSHGTPCAGVACGSGLAGASGVAPKARLMPIRAPSREVGSVLQSDAIRWAVDHGADVICCSWGPPDGPIGVTADPRHNEIHQLPEDIRLALDYAVTAGRDKLGCIVTFAAGNGNESVDNDKYASYDNVVAIAACNDQGKRCFYSDYGNAIWCAFPSGDSWYGRTTGIWTTDRTGSDGLNVGIDAEGDWAGNYTNSFSGTSSACAGAAGIAALIVQKYPKATWQEVKERMKDCCDRIDEPDAQYDPATGHSPYLGYGRLNAGKI